MMINGQYNVWERLKPYVKAVHRLLPRLIARIPNRLTRLNLPSKAYVDAVEWNKIATKKKGEKYNHLNDASIVRYEKPICYPQFLEEHQDFNTSYKLVSSYELILKDAEVRDARGVVLNHEKATIGDVSFVYGCEPIEHPIFRKLILPKAIKLEGTYGLIHSPSPNNYFHWVHEVIPQLIACKEKLVKDDIQKILCCLEFSFQKQWLKILGIDMSKVILLKDGLAYSIETLHFYSMPSRNGAVPPKVFDLLKMAVHGIEESRRDRKLYIVRETGSRAVSYRNGDKNKLLDSYGFERLKLEEMSVVEQIMAFKEAAVVLTPHGAGVTGITFCQPDTIIIEMHTPLFFNTCYWRVAKENKLKYFCLLGGDVQKLSEISQPVQPTSKIEIDLQKLRQVLVEAGVDK